MAFSALILYYGFMQLKTVLAALHFENLFIKYNAIIQKIRDLVKTHFLGKNKYVSPK